MKKDKLWSNLTPLSLAAQHKTLAQDTQLTYHSGGIANSGAKLE